VQPTDGSGLFLSLPFVPGLEKSTDPFVVMTQAYVSEIPFPYSLDKYEYLPQRPAVGEFSKPALAMCRVWGGGA